MITRGYIIGKIVDDIAGLKYQVETRNRLGLFDLTKFTEDFFKEMFNIVYSLRLTNLNKDRSNNPGIDLGDAANKIAYQITSTKTSQKVSDTLTVLTPTQIQAYPAIKVFIVGEKQSNYTITKGLQKATGFKPNEDIVDLDDLLKDVMVLPVEKLDELLSLFNREFRALKIEFEPMDKEGNFESSLYNQLEKRPDQPPSNAGKLADQFDGEDFTYKSIKKFYRQLSGVPRVSREMLAIIAERGKVYNSSFGNNRYGILPKVLQNSLRMSKDEMESELLILLDAKLLYTDEDFIDDRPVHVAALNGDTINTIVHWAKDNDISLRALFNTMDFTVMDI